MDPQDQARTYLELRRKLPRPDKGSNLQPEKQLQALIVVVSATLPVVDYNSDRNARKRAQTNRRDNELCTDVSDLPCSAIPSSCDRT